VRFDLGDSEVPLPTRRDLASSLALRPDTRGDSAGLAFFAEGFFTEESVRPPCGEDRLLDIDYGLGNTNQKVIEIIEDFKAISTTIFWPRQTTVLPDPAGPEEVCLRKQKQTNKQTTEKKNQAVGKIQKGKMKAFPLPFGTKFRIQYDPSSPALLLGGQRPFHKEKALRDFHPLNKNPHP
jgi:hypothetical protein